MKTTIYELLGMIKDNNAPKKILYKGVIWEYKENEKDYSNKEWNEWLFDVYLITEILNDFIEILETTITYKQDKIEKISEEEMKLWHEQPALYDDLAHKVNEIIDILNKEEL